LETAQALVAAQVWASARAKAIPPPVPAWAMATELHQTGATGSSDPPHAATVTVKKSAAAPAFESRKD
jgi:hypothetical protein